MLSLTMKEKTPFFIIFKDLANKFRGRFVCLGLKSRGGGGDSHMKHTGMLVVSLRGVNFGFWSRLGCSGQNDNYLWRQGLV